MPAAHDSPALRLVRDDDPRHALILRSDGGDASHPKPAIGGILRQGRDTGSPLRNARETARAVRRVESANRSASNLSPMDARRIFAARVAESIEGGKAALLPVERRQGLMRVARTLGIRTFDANLVIAIAQDAARRGQLGQATADPRLGCVGAPAEAEGGQAQSLPPREALGGKPSTVRRRRALLRLAVIAAIAAVMLASLISWIIERS